MRFRKACAHLSILGGTLIAPAVNAADNCTGHFHNVSQNAETSEIAKGFTLATFTFYSLTSSDNSANNAMGTCSGYSLSTPDGKTRLAGICARKTKNGDNWADTWVSDPGSGDRGQQCGSPDQGTASTLTHGSPWQGEVPLADILRPALVRSPPRSIPASSRPVTGLSPPGR